MKFSSIVRTFSFVFVLSLAALFSGGSLNGQTLVYQGAAPSLGFGNVNVCPAAQTSPSPCNETLSLSYNVTGSGTIGSVQALTKGSPNLDFTLATGNTCTGAVLSGTTCNVNVTFAPAYAGVRSGAVQILDTSGNLLASTLIYGVGVAPQLAFNPGTQTVLVASSAIRLALDGAGDLFTSHYESAGYIGELPASTGYQTENVAVNNLSYPDGVTLDGAGNILAALPYGIGPGVDPSTSVVVQAPQGGVPVVLGGTLYQNGEDVLGVTEDGAGDVFYTQEGTSGVVELPAIGGSPQFFADILPDPPPFAPSEGGDLWEVSADAAGNLFALDAIFGRVAEFAAGTGEETLVYSDGPSSFPTDSTIDAADDVYIAEGGNNRILEFSTATSGTNILARGGFNPTGVAMDGAGDLFVAYYYGSIPNPANPGYGYSPAVVMVNRSLPPSLTFAATNVGNTSSDSPQSIQIQNIGNTVLSLSGLAVTGNFSLVAGSGTPADCTASSALDPGVSCNLSVSFTPAASGPLTGAITLTDNTLNATSAAQAISLSGTGVSATPIAPITPNPLNFVAIGYGSSETLQLNIENIGTGMLTLNSMPVVNGPSYKIVGNNCPVGGMAAETSCALTIEFAPITVGVHNDLMPVSTNGGNVVVNLNGTAAGVGSILEAPLNFGTIPNGTTETLKLTIYDFFENGLPTVTFSINGPSYKVVPGSSCVSVGLAAGGSCTVSITFDPIAVGTHDDVLTITPTIGQPSRVNLNGIASGIGAIIEAPVNFGTIAFGTTETLPLNIFNVGVPGSITVGATINGPSYKIASSTCTAGVTAGNFCTLQVEFNPVKVGVHDDILTITPSGGATASTVNLNGVAN